jgi:WD40 repeat protein
VRLLCPDAIRSLVRDPASGSNDGTVKLWSLSSRALILTVPVRIAGIESEVSALAVNAQSQLLICHSSTLQFFSTVDGAPNAALSSRIASTGPVAVSPDGMTLATADGSGNIMLWALPDGTLLRTLTGHTAAVQKLVITADGSSLVSVAANGAAKMWSVSDGTLFGTFATFNGTGAWPVAVSADGATLACSRSVGSGYSVEVLSVPSGAHLTTVSITAESLALSPDGRLLMVGGGNAISLIRVYGVPDGTLLAELDNRPNNIGSAISPAALVTTPDGQLLVSSDDRDVKLWNLSTMARETCLYDPALPADVDPAPDCSSKPSGLACSCDTVCTCDTVSSGGGSSYYYPN